jgi:hypothetical protein
MYVTVGYRPDIVRIVRMHWNPGVEAAHVTIHSHCRKVRLLVYTIPYASSLKPRGPANTISLPPRLQKSNQCVPILVDDDALTI